MALPLLIGIGAAVLGAAGHSVAKETNEKAQRIANEAQEIYDDAKQSLEIAQSCAEESLNEFAETKKNVLQNSMTRFLLSFERVKHIQLGDTPGLEEIKKFSIKPADILQLQHMADIQDNFGSGTVGVAAGMGLATLGGAGLLSFTGLSAIAGPVMLFTAFSASTKADENLEKAQQMYSQAKSAVSKMRTSETLCNAIQERSEMFDKLLQDCNEYFAMATAKLEDIIFKRVGFFGAMSSAPIPAEKFTEKDKDVMAVAFSLAGTVKAVIDTPILSKNGNLDKDSQTKYNEFTRALSSSKAQVKAIEAGTVSRSHVESIKAGKQIKTFNLPQWLNKAVCAVLLIMFVRYFYSHAEEIVSTNYFILKAVGVGFVSFIAWALTSYIRWNFLKTASGAFCSLLLAFSIGSLVFGLLSWLGLSFMFSIIISEMIALFFAWIFINVVYDMANKS
ncbi:MAG: hypothetical protein IJS40_01540 [Synergistaceae bacterium]|nr:hypothetical protein [Synergistaceae bacterium]